MSAPGLHHLDLVVTSVERSGRFYRQLLAPLGWQEGGTIEGERGEKVSYLTGGAVALGLREKQSDAHQVPYDRYAVGVHHLAFAASSRESVDERAGWLRSEGVEIESGPQEYDYLPGYYAVFFRDPDGMKLEIVYVPPGAT